MESFFNEYDEMEFTKDELVKELINKAGNLDGLEKFSEKSVEADGEALLRMYVRKPEREVIRRKRTSARLAFLNW